MINDFSARYRRWFAYEKDCHAKTLTSLRSVPEDRRATPAFEQAVTLLGHVVAARRLWLFRLGEAPEGPRTFFPQELSLEELEQQVAEMQTAWTVYLHRLDDVELARVFTYRSMEGEPFSNTIEDILTQMFGHAWYHRGQIAALVRSLGGTPVPTDFVFWTRTPVDMP